MLALQSSIHDDDGVRMVPNVGLHYSFSDSSECASICSISQAVSQIEGIDATAYIDLTLRVGQKIEHYYYFKSTDPGCYFVRPRSDIRINSDTSSNVLDSMYKPWIF